MQQTLKNKKNVKTKKVAKKYLKSKVKRKDGGTH
jgi:hypothetical protein